jgi:hypothetical protein
MANETATFVMHGAREVLALAGAAVHLEQQINAIENAVIKSPNLAADLARTLVETICKTILTDRGQTDCDKLGFKDLLKQTYSAVQLVPDAKLGSPESQAALRQLADNLDSAILGISQLRQAEGVASHGKDAYFAPLEIIQAEFAARAADALIAFLYKSHRRYSGSFVPRLLEYKDNSNLNDYIDSRNDLARIFEYEYKASEVLFYVDRQAYLDVLTNFTQDTANQDAVTAADEAQL